jgi:hypothetical protein
LQKDKIAKILRGLNFTDLKQLLMQKKFEYKIFRIPRGIFTEKIDLQETLNQYGLEGWELVTGTQYELGEIHTFIFKREVIG